MRASTASIGHAAGPGLIIVRLTSLGHNLSSDFSCALGGSGDLSGVDPVLGSWSDNGGATQPHELVVGSPAIDAIRGLDCTDTNGNPITADQRAIARPLDGDGDGIAQCDIGAFERQPASVGGIAEQLDVAALPASTADHARPYALGIALAILSVTGASVCTCSGSVRRRASPRRSRADATVRCDEHHLGIVSPDVGPQPAGCSR